MEEDGELSSSAVIRDPGCGLPGPPRGPAAGPAPFSAVPPPGPPPPHPGFPAAAAAGSGPQPAPRRARPHGQDRYTSLAGALAQKRAEVAALERARETLRAREAVLSLAVAGGDAQLRLLGGEERPEEDSRDSAPSSHPDSGDDDDGGGNGGRRGALGAAALNSAGASASWGWEGRLTAVESGSAGRSQASSQVSAAAGGVCRPAARCGSSQAPPPAVAAAAAAAVAAKTAPPAADAARASGVPGGHAGGAAAVAPAAAPPAALLSAARFPSLAAPSAVVDHAIDLYGDFIQEARQAPTAPFAPSPPALVASLRAMHHSVRALHAQFPLLRQQLLATHLVTRRPCRQPEGHWGRAVAASALPRRLSQWSRLQMRGGLWFYESMTARPRAEREELEARLGQLLSSHQQAGQTAVSVSPDGLADAAALEYCELVESLERGLRRELTTTNIFLFGGGRILPREFLPQLLVAGWPYWPDFVQIVRECSMDHF
ncbi:hypothetical protein Rsub_05663 [Raphidocelis subcapitata]|uniref:Uncharacterized protein n=1 Tax=Raphidocelis subcapitata TaxID=307507 RepID=A0A2V0P2D2_9CHLO|nr:hypothetical protein Rsub_05663 [Raphidocelis subcapitata]|eukprot:GBF93052.1 hypothetical protein Rsub_05663 [Raphidocelis subcapitata]